MSENTNLKISHIKQISLWIVAISMALWSGGANAATDTKADYDMITDLGSSAEMIGIGNIEGFSTGAHGVFENPASLYRVERGSMSFFTTTLIDEIHYNAFAISSETPIGRVGIGFMEVAVDGLIVSTKNASNEHEPGSVFDFKNNVFKISYQSSYEDLHFGVSYTAYTNTFYTIQGKGDNIDAGLIWDSVYGDISFHVRNLIPDRTVYYNTNGEEILPQEYVVSGKSEEYYDLQVLAQAKNRSGKTMMSYGLIYSPEFLPYLNLVVGSKDYLVLGQEIRRNTTFGVGLSMYDFHFHYAYEKGEHYQFDGKHYFSASMNF